MENDPEGVAGALAGFFRSKWRSRQGGCHEGCDSGRLL